MSRYKLAAEIFCVRSWQHFGNKKSVSQNKLCNRSKKAAFLQQNLNRII